MTEEQFRQFMERLNHWGGEICTYLNGISKTLDDIRANQLDQREMTVTIDPPAVSSQGCTCYTFTGPCPMHGYSRSA